jgi:crotonobetainyl-CoA:carnitine CoA-transferase CaiB-like acyl-CoA transferase
MCGLMLAFIVAAAIWRRRRDGGVARVDFSMIEAMLWTMAEPLLATQCGAAPKPRGNRSDRHAPHGAWRCAGDDAWISIAVANDEQWRRLCGIVADLSPLCPLGLRERMARRETIDAVLGAWCSGQDARTAERALLGAGVPAAALASSVDLAGSEHLRERGFWEAHSAGVLPGLPWRASFGRRSGDAPGLGADTDAVLSDVLCLSDAEIERLRRSGALG